MESGGYGTIWTLCRSELFLTCVFLSSIRSFRWPLPTTHKISLHHSQYFLQDCDNDSDCIGDLRCWQRSGLVNNVPGCEGQAVEHVDYCYDPGSVMSENIVTIPAGLLTTAPSKRPTTQAPIQTPTQVPTETNEDEFWNAFMGMVSTYANANKNRLGEDSPEPSPEPTSAFDPDDNSSSQPTSEFHAAWKGGMERWKKSIQKDAGA